MSPSNSPKVDPETAVAILTQKADLARAQIRGLVNSLPDSEAEMIVHILDNPPQEETEQQGGFHWDKLPAEVKNIIYRFVFVAERPIKPHINWPNVPHRRYISKFGLGANFLRCSKAIYGEAHPILRMENTFEIGTQFRICLGEDRGKRNSALIRKIFLRPEKLSWTLHGIISRLDNKEELTLADRYPFRGCDTQAVAEESAARAFADIESRLWHSVSPSYFCGRFSKVYYVAERFLKVSADSLCELDQTLTVARAGTCKETIALLSDSQSNTIRGLMGTA